MATAGQQATQDAKKLETLGNKITSLEAFVAKGKGKGGPKKQPDLKRVLCFNCKEKGHFARDCTKAKTTGAAAVSEGGDPKKTGAVAIGKGQVQNTEVDALQQFAANMLMQDSDFRSRP